tara:strand:- start:129 stop:383 length:255 start_codon:yes stop_codon:yes gene_type:complete
MPRYCGEHKNLKSGDATLELNTIVNLVEIPIIIAGGCGSKQDCVAAIKAGASAVAGGSVFFWIGESIITIKEFMKEHDIEVRIL